MNIVVTGAEGFIGSGVVPELEKDHQVHAYTKETGNVVTGFDAPDDADLVIHLAAQTSSKAAHDDPLTDFETNVMGTFNMLEYARKVKAKFIYPSSQKAVPEKGEQRGIHGLGKYVAERYVMEYSLSYHVPVIINRFGNLYGPGGDNFFVNKITKSVVDEKQVEIWGGGDQSRDILWLDDLVDLLVDQVNNFDLYAQKPMVVAGGGPENEVSILDILDYFKYTNKRHYPVLVGDKDRNVTDNSDVSEINGWHPKTPWQEGLDLLKTYYENRS